ncbi:hypothetical protein FRC00_007380, partial [Tulasnella sp. 408]
MFEKTGGSEGYLRHLEATNSATDNAPQVDKNEPGLIYDKVNIVIEVGKPAPKHFHITVTTEAAAPGAPVYQGSGYGWAPNAINKEFPGALTLVAPGWDPIIKAGEIPFTWVKGPETIANLVDWEGFVDGKAVITFGGIAEGEGGLEGTSGVMT